ncbi:MAG TPA: hypothetical protein VOA80_24895, partial [Thermoanaerobaculia bacterium]|nr:hypothetical protein [Thermoanaerobaculia bacterium]
MPLTEIWGTLSEYTLVQELQFLRTTLLRDDGARTLFAQRLVDQVGKRERVFTILANAGFVTKENLDE